MAAKSVPPRPVPRLYLATPVVDDPSQLVAGLPGLLAVADIAAVLLRLRETDQRTMISRIKALVSPVQDGGAALLLDGHVELVARGGADGAHLNAMNRIGGLPWKLTFSYGRALQAAPQKAWSGKAENIAAGQRAFTHRAKMNALASKGEWETGLEKKVA